MPDRRGQRCRVVGYELRTQVGGDSFGSHRMLTVQFEDGLTISAERGMVKTAQGYRDTAAGRFGVVRSGKHRRGDDQ
jgi:hypothetical protein